MISTQEMIRHRLVFDDRQAARYPWIRQVDSAIRENPDCETGVMTRQGWACSDNGPNSDGDRPELLVEITRGIRRSPASDNWYGHVFFRGDRVREPDVTGSISVDRGKWVSMLVRTWVRPDGPIPDVVLRQWRILVVTGHKWTPGYYQDREDTCAKRSSFEDAVHVLIRQIRRFRRVIRVEKIVGHDDYGDFRIPIYEDPDDGVQDLSPMGIYRFGDQLCKAFADQERRP